MKGDEYTYRKYIPGFTRDLWDGGYYVATNFHNAADGSTLSDNRQDNCCKNSF